MAAGSYERRFGGSRKIVYGNTEKDHPALSIQCFERRHNDCQGRCAPFEPLTVCECECHKEQPNG